MSESAGQRPLLLRIVDAIRARIDSGELAPGDKLPTTRALQKEFDASIQTVQRAISVLKSEGVVEAISTKGVFVRSPRERITRALSFLSTAGPPARRGSPVVTGVRVAEPEGDIADVLRAAPGGTAVVHRAMYIVDGEPAEVVDTYFPMEPGTAVEIPRTSTEDTVVELRRRGVEPHRRVERLRARMPTPDEARALKLPPGVPVFRVLTSFLDDEGRLLAVEDAVLNGDRYELLYELPIHD